MSKSQSYILISKEKLSDLVANYIKWAEDSFTKEHAKERAKGIARLKKSKWFGLVKSKWADVPDEEIPDREIICLDPPFFSDLAVVKNDYSYRLKGMDKFTRAIELSNDEYIALTLADIERYGFGN